MFYSLAGRARNIDVGTEAAQLPSLAGMHLVCDDVPTGVAPHKMSEADLAYFQVTAQAKKGRAAPTLVFALPCGQCGRGSTDRFGMAALAKMFAGGTGSAQFQEVLAASQAHALAKVAARKNRLTC